MRSLTVALLLSIMVFAIPLAVAKDGKVRREGVGSTSSAPVTVTVDEEDDDTNEAKNTKPNNRSTDRLKSSAGGSPSEKPTLTIDPIVQTNERSASDALLVIQLATQCPIPNETTSKGGQSNLANEFNGTRNMLHIVQVEMHSNRYGEMSSSRLLTRARWVDFSEVFVSANRNRVVLECRAKGCVSGTLDDRAISGDRTFINLCDKSTAQNAARAAAILVQLNGGKVDRTGPRGPDDFR